MTQEAVERPEIAFVDKLTGKEERFRQMFLGEIINEPGINRFVPPLRIPEAFLGKGVVVSDMSVEVKGETVMVWCPFHNPPRYQKKKGGWSQCKGCEAWLFFDYGSFGYGPGRYRALAVRAFRK